MPSRPSLLYVTPVLPAPTGNGLAMRAGMVLEALARHYHVTLRVDPLYAAPDERLDPRLARLCDRERRRFGGGRRYDVAHVFRLAAIPDSVPADRRQIDLDEVDSAAHRSLAALYSAKGEHDQARRLTGIAAHYESLERQLAETGERLFVASPAERGALWRLGAADVRVLPNAVRPPASPLPRRQSGTDLVLFFVGTLGYVANEDAVRSLCDEVLPLLEADGKPTKVVVAGSGGTPALAKLASRPNVEFVGQVPDLEPYYERADAVVVPLRAGGGTRIKILEAFAYGRPVVSTTLGCAGLEVRDGEHLLIGDTAEAFAQRCLQLAADPGLAQQLTDAAGVLVRHSHTIDAVAAAVDPEAPPPPRAPGAAAPQPIPS